MKNWFSGGRVPQLGWERDLGQLRRRHKVMGNLIYFLAIIGLFHLVNEVIRVFGAEPMSPITGLTFGLTFTLITYLSLPVEEQQ